MWCDRCRADVAAAVASDSGRAACATCGSDLGTTRRPATEEARELLRRWSGEADQTFAERDDFRGPATPAAFDIEAAALPIAPEPATAVAPRNPVADRQPAADREPATNHDSVRVRRPAAPVQSAAPPRLRLDGAHSQQDRSQPAPQSGHQDDDQFEQEREALIERPRPAQRQAPAQRRFDGPQAAQPPHRSGAASRVTREQQDELRIDAPHPRAAAPPHFDVHTSMATRAAARSNASVLIGQLLSYAGVLALTLGTAMVIWGYFGGPADYAPTGWLIATGGQMLLFLGVVTLISGGLEQTGREVRVRVESLGERLVRIEQVAAGHGLRGPHFATEHIPANQHEHAHSERML